MKIAIVSGPFGPMPPNAIGAVERRWYYVGKEMRQQGVKVELYAKKDKDYLKEDNINCVKGFKRSRFGTKIDILKDFIYSFKILLKLKKCDILVVNTFWLPILSPLFFWKYKKLVYNVARTPRSHLKLYTGVDLFSCVSHATAKQTRSILGDNKNIVTVNNPVNLSLFASKQYKTKIDKEIVFGYHGRIHREKGLHILVRALSRLATERNIKLVLIGPVLPEFGGSGAEYFEELNKEAQGFDIEHKESISNPMQLAEELSKFNIYCYPSIAEQGETFGVSPLEAMASGLPVIVSNLECFRDFVSPLKNALVFNHRVENPEIELADCINTLIQDQALRENLISNGVRTAQKFSISNVANSYLSHFNMLLNSELTIFNRGGVTYDIPLIKGQILLNVA